MLINPETGLAYTVPQLSGTINKVPRLKKTLTKHLESITISDGLMTSVTAFDRRNGKLGIISSKPHGAPATQIEVGGFKPIPIIVPHYPAEIQIKAEEVEGLRKEGTVDEFLMPEDLLMEKMAAGSQVLDAVEEHQFEGAIRSQLIDADGTEAFDLSAFGGPTLDNLELSNPNTDVPRFFREFKRKLRKHLTGYNVAGYKIFAPGELYEDIVSHPSVKEIWKLYRDGEKGREDTGELGGLAITTGMQLIEFEEEEVSGFADGNSMGPVDDILVVPMARGLIRRFYAPKKGYSTINRKALPRYASSEKLKHDAGDEVKMETNVITFSEVGAAMGVVNPT